MGLRWGDRAGSLHPTRRHFEFNRAVSVAIVLAGILQLAWTVVAIRRIRPVYAPRDPAAWTSMRATLLFER